MLQARQVFAVVSASLLLVQLALADIPVHCLHRQTLGTWVFRLGSNDHDETHQLAHQCEVLTEGGTAPWSIYTLLDE